MITPDDVERTVLEDTRSGHGAWMMVKDKKQAPCT
jgi:hypothetical protein